MAKGGALKPVYVVTDEELEINGGEFVLQQGPALKVRGFTLDNYAGRKVQGGAAQPVYVVPEASAPSLHGGHWRVIAGEPIKVLSVTEAERNIIQGPAIPVYPVDDAGAYDPDFAGAPYYQKVLSYGPIAYWPLWETAGVVAEELVNGWNGTYARNVALMGTGPGIGDGYTSPHFDGLNDFVNIISAGLAAAFNGAEFSILIWVYADPFAAVTYSHRLHSDGNNFTRGAMTAANNYRATARAATLYDIINDGTYTTGNWEAYVATRSEAALQFTLYKDGALIGVPVVTAGVYAGALVIANIGLDQVNPAQKWDGYISHFAVFAGALPPASAIDLTTL